MFGSKVAEQDGEVWKVGKNQPGCPLSTLHDLRRILRVYIYITLIILHIIASTVATVIIGNSC